MPRMVYIRPTENDFLEYSVLTLPVKQEAISNRWDVVVLEGNKAVRNEFEDAVMEKTDIVYGVGHGFDYTFTGQWLERILCAAGDQFCNFNNTSMVKDVKHLHLLSCLTAKGLLPKCIEAGCNSTSGYIKEWLWVIDPDYSPVTDPYATSFFSSDNELTISLVRGYSLDDAVERCKAYYMSQAMAWAKWLNENPNISPEQKARVLATIKLLLYDSKILDINKRIVRFEIPIWPIVAAAIPIGIYLLFKKK